MSQKTKAADMKLTIEHFGGRADVKDTTELTTVLGLRFGDGFNEFWITGSRRFPHMVLAVAPEGAAMHYFPKKGHPGFRSMGNRSKTGSMAFRTNTPEQKLMVAKSSIISVQLANAAVAEFFHTHGLPPIIEWEEL